MLRANNRPRADVSESSARVRCDWFQVIVTLTRFAETPTLVDRLIPPLTIVSLATQMSESEVEW